MKWTQEKPKEIGIYIKSNPALQKDLTTIHVLLVDGILTTQYICDGGHKLTKIKDMPKSFWYLKIPLPPFQNHDASLYKF